MMPDNNSDNDMTRSHVVLTAGTMVSHYRIVEKIGAGGMGEVYLAEDGNLARKVALKFLPAHLTANEDIKSRFTREARTIARLNHPNIVGIHEVGDHNGRPYIVMELVEGESLNMIARGKPLSLDRILDYAMQICSGLEEAHSAGIIHRDVKPANIVIDKQNRVRLLDFGLAWVAGDDKLTVTGTTMGTLSYMSPEQLQGGKLGPQSDIFALGIILYELTCGNHPFAESSSAEAAARILRDEPADVRSRRPDAPYDLARVIKMCLKKDPTRRFQSVRDVHNELLDIAEKADGDSIDQFQTALNGAPDGSLKEEKFVLSADLVRKLEIRSPKMVGDRLIYFDNNKKSDTMIIYLHPWGVDHRHTREFLTSLPCRALAPVLYGFDHRSPNRLPLTFADQSTLMRAFFTEIYGVVRPRRIVLTGFSSGADHALHLATSDPGPGIPLTGLISFGCNISLRSCFLSSKFAKLKSSDPGELLEDIKKIGANARSMSEWLKFHEYMVDVFVKFGSNADPIRSFAKGIVDPFKKDDWRHFANRYRKAIKEIKFVKFIVDNEDFDKLDGILAHHLESNVLGDDFREDSIVRENVTHIQLSNVEFLLKHTADLLGQIQS